ncbi:MAG: site-specific integrase, partial [Pseudomonadota bacterium]
MSRDLISMFLEAQAAELGAAENTMLAYGRDLLNAHTHFLAQNTTLETADQSRLEQYLIHCDAQGLAQATRARRLSALKQFYRFLFEEGLRTDNPALHIRGLRQDKKLPDDLSIKEVDALLSAARSTGRREQDRLRNTCLLEVLYATGLRVSELVSLPLSAVQGDPRMILVR